jgi:Zn-dependent M32 family carboxypeptidase
MDLEKRIDDHDRQYARHEKMMQRIDKRLDATSKLVQAGMKMIIADRKQQKENWRQQKEANENFEHELNALIHSQQETGQQIKQLTGKMDRFIDELRRGNRNGHSS